MGDFTMPKVAMSDDEEMLITQWLVAEGEAFTDGQPLLEVETAKASMEIEAPSAGVLAVQVRHPGESVLAGVLIARFAAPGEDYSPEASETPLATSDAPVPASPDLAEANAVASSGGPADSGSNGARQASAVLVAPLGPQELPDPDAEDDVSATGPSLSPAVPGDLYGVPVRRRPAGRARTADPTLPWAEAAPTRESLSRHRRALGRLMTQSAAIPQFAVQRDVPMLSAERTVQQLRASGVRATVTDVLLRVTAQALVRHPEMNSHFNGEDLYRYPDPAIALAADSPGGVVAPVVRKAHLLSWEDLAIERRRIVEGARNGRLLPGDMAGGTFSISNVGALGGDSVIPMLTPPQVGILGLGRARPAWGATVARAVLVADHRVLDGADAARFLATLAELLDDVHPSEPHDRSPRS